MEGIREIPKYPITIGSETNKSPTEAGKIIANHEPVFEFKKQRSFNSRGEGSAGGGRPRFNCLCSPTTHAGSFRCRHHRGLGGMSRGGSVGSNLSMLGAKSGLSDSLQAQ